MCLVNLPTTYHVQAAQNSPAALFSSDIEQVAAQVSSIKEVCNDKIPSQYSPEKKLDIIEHSRDSHGTSRGWRRLPVHLRKTCLEGIGGHRGFLEV